MIKTIKKIEKMKSYANIVNNNDIERRIFTMMAIGFSVFVAIYLFLLCNMVFNIIGRKNMEMELRSLSSSVGNLELSYLSLSQKANLDLAHQMGFSESTNKEFAARKAIGSLKASFGNDL